ncbi:hypothetical protein EXIGLDRAFT_729222 [Exidia glandulosa HHB12029]|uniref:Uncharacterized protein n=1 Tax=Exidia glandulosa HHB12029 TaxID=1314781 RepID=A0A165LMM2_EXIGL|nr:hypothetical protein EXIGLDRAFT_729222 [Exidia glandulosa HHB12029]
MADKPGQQVPPASSNRNQTTPKSSLPAPSSPARGNQSKPPGAAGSASRRVSTTTPVPAHPATGDTPPHMFVTPDPAASKLGSQPPLAQPAPAIAQAAGSSADATFITAAGNQDDDDEDSSSPDASHRRQIP